MMIKTRRKTIKDDKITQEMYFNILEKLVDTSEDLSQKNIALRLREYNLSNKLIARVINDIVPNAKATAGSVAIIFNNAKKKDDMFDTLINQLKF